MSLEFVSNWWKSTRLSQKIVFIPVIFTFVFLGISFFIALMEIVGLPFYILVPSYSLGYLDWSKNLMGEYMNIFNYPIGVDGTPLINWVVVFGSISAIIFILIDSKKVKKIES